MSRTTARPPRRAAAVVLILLSSATLVLVPPSAAAEPSCCAPPVSAPVLDPFRAPAGPYGAGNRGLEYDTVPGQPASAVADGVVVFAGQVAGRLVVSVEHPDGLRSSLTGLATVAVAAGAEVRRGTVLGTAGAHLHLGIRRDGEYLDPAALFALGGERGAAHLVPSDGPLVGLAAAEELAPTSRAFTRVACPPACKPAG